MHERNEREYEGYEEWLDWVAVENAIIEQMKLDRAEEHERRLYEEFGPID